MDMASISIKNMKWKSGNIDRTSFKHFKEHFDIFKHVWEPYIFSNASGNIKIERYLSGKSWNF